MKKIVKLFKPAANSSAKESADFVNLMKTFEAKNPITDKERMRHRENVMQDEVLRNLQEWPKYEQIEFADIDREKVCRMDMNLRTLK